MKMKSSLEALIVVTLLLSSLTYCHSEINDSTLIASQADHQAIEWQTLLIEAINARNQINFNLSSPESAWILRNSHREKAPLEASSPTNGSSDCLLDLLYTISALRNPQQAEWALSMIDAVGKPSSGLLRGAINWPGYFRECLEVRADREEKAGLSYGGFRGKYCSIGWSLAVNESLAIPIQQGLCIPSSCNSSNIVANLDSIKFLIDFIPGAKGLLNRTKLSGVRCLPVEHPMNGEAITCLTLLLTLLGICIIGTVAEKLEQRRNLLNEYKSLVNDNHINEGDASGASAVAVSYEDEIIVIRSNPLERRAGKVLEVFKCFSLCGNGIKLFEVKKSTRSQIRCIHGIRFLSMAWIVICHCYVFSILIFENILDIFNDIDNFPFYTVLNGSYSVDSFFLLSGLLLGYLFFTDREQRMADDKPLGVKYWLSFYFHRIWRLTPIYAAVLWFVASLANYTSSGPFWDYGDLPTSEHTMCGKSWWKNLLYVNNFQPLNETCMAWSWYLANDMQFYVISPIFLTTISYFPRIGISLTAMTIVASSVTSFVISYKNNLQTAFQINAQTPDNMQGMFDYFDLFYTKPYCRIGPYLVGLLTGYFIYHYVKRPYSIRKIYLYLGWMLSATLLLTSLYSTYHANPTRVEAAFYNSLSRTSWGFGLSWVVFACVTGNAGRVEKILSSSFWVPLSRLTFAAYLIHPILLNYFYRSLESGLRFTHLLVLVFVGSALFWVFLLSIIVTLVYEAPFLRLESLIFKRKQN